MRKGALCSIAVLAFSASLGAKAQQVQDCNAALVKSTFGLQQSEFFDWRLATLVDEATYNELKKDASANATIYGIPMGANYAEFQKNYATKRSTHNESLSRTQALNVAWTGLDPNGASAYATCVQSQLFASRGLHVAVKAATITDISLLINWLPQGRDPGTIKPTWVWKDKGKGSFPVSLTQGQTVVVLKRPSDQQTFAVNFPGYGDSVTISPLPVKLVDDPKPVIDAAVVYDSPPTASGACAGWGNWAELCTPAKPAGWTIVDHSFSLSGDRAGCAWAHCEQKSASPTQVCYRFQMQGHSEQCGIGHGSNTGIQNSTGHIRVVWSHP